MIIAILILRGIQGFTRMFSGVSCRSLLAILQPDEEILYMGYYEAAMNIGTGIGPVLGALLYELLGFRYIFMILGWYHLIYVPLMILFIPSDIDSDQDDMKSLVLDRRSDLQAEPKISISRLYCNKLVLLLSIAEILAYFAYSYFEPLLSFRVAEFTESVYIQGLMYSIFIVGITVMALTAPYISKLIHPIHMIFLGLLL